MAAERARFLGVGAFRKPHRGEHVVEGLRIVVDGAQQGGLQRLCALGERRRGLPGRFIAGLADREVRDHRRERGAEAAGERRDRAAARRRRVARDFVDEALDGHGDEGSRHAHSVLDDPLVRVEGRELGEAQRLDGELDEFAFGQAGRAALLAQVVAAGLDQRLERRQPHELGARHDQPELRGFLARGLEDLVQRRGRGSSAG